MAAWSNSSRCSTPRPYWGYRTSGLCVAAAPLPSSLQTRGHEGHVEPSPCFYTAHVSMLHFWWFGISPLFQSAHPLCPPPGRLTSVPSVLLFNLLKNNRLFCWAGREVRPNGAQTHTMPYMRPLRNSRNAYSVAQVWKVTSFSCIHGIFRLWKQMSFLITKWKDASQRWHLSPTHTHTRNTVKLH